MESKNIRNIALLGHGNSGKTSLAESMLFVTGAIDRLGKVSDGNTVCDYDAEEIKRQITIASSLAPVSFGGGKVNVLDCPGYFDFVGEVLCSPLCPSRGGSGCDPLLCQGRNLRRCRAQLEIPEGGQSPDGVRDLQVR